ncbi:hypothetical protein BCR35DRAFT_303477 [Leucosporidium creatinivorum]|uniref:Fe2OG dioxygenase domain-containing protein n=1 Tax=Leucosporidium creatinivorum TaxID=106004 RepID=A0A1Y2FI14_9BASI|nr:hypothetical protein BCR35DRAFT_303477 [Leucosporidium creatinivorum]
MGKLGKNLKRRKLEQQAQQAKFAPTSALDSDDEQEQQQLDFLGGLISPTQLQTTVTTLQTLTRHTQLLANKQDLKSLRGAVFDFQRLNAELSGTGTSLPSRISSALSDSRHLDALVLLSELQLRQQHPKLGALQRWVRDCDAASRSDGSFGDEMVLRVLDAVLRCTNGVPTESEEVGLKKGSGVVVRQEEWVVREKEGDDIWKEIQEGRFPDPAQRPLLSSHFTLLQTTPGPDRLPPNHHPALLFSSSPGTIPLSPIPSTPVKRIEVPHVPGAFLLTDVLSREECRSILAHAEAVGFKPDQPVGDEGGASVLAHNLYWLADRTFLDTFCSRFLHLVPQVIDGGKVTGINARFRVYRYVPGAIYRPHIDGAWPASGVDPVTGEYLYDSSPPSSPQWSRLTFLIYLNDAFSNGCTTFFLPSSRPSTMNAFPIKPSTGCALVFPHGDSRGSLLHEGSPVGVGGAKYVIRSEVLYQVVKGPVGTGTGGKEGEKDEGVEV